MGADDLAKCNAAIAAKDLEYGKAYLAKQMEWLNAGMGGPDIISLEAGSCYKDGDAANKKAKEEGPKAATLADCEALVAKAVDVSACYVMPEKAPTGGGCAANADGVRRACAAETECCGGMKENDEATANAAEFCFDKTKTDIKGADNKANFVYTWFILADWKKQTEAAVAASADATKWAAFNEPAAEATRGGDLMKLLTAAEAKEYDFACIEGARNIAASAAALLAASYIMA